MFGAEERYSARDRELQVEDIFDGSSGSGMRIVRQHRKVVG